MCCSARVEEGKSMTAGSLSFSSASASVASVASASVAPASASVASASAPLATPQEVASESNPSSTVLLENSSGSLYLLRVSPGCNGNCSSILPGMKYR